MSSKGKVKQISIKPNKPGECGLPKSSVNSVKVTVDGLKGDYNNYRQKERNGTLDRAVLIMTMDKMEEINSEGWSIKPGDLGENFTIEGLVYDNIEIGDRYKIGDLEIEITEPCNPCNNLRELSYVGSDKITEFIQTMKGRRGWYGKVDEEAIVTTGDPVIKLES